MTQQLTEASVNSRFQLIDRPVKAPGKCTVCGASDRPVIDIRMDLEAIDIKEWVVDITVYFCVLCLTECATTILDMVPAAQLRDAQLVAEEANNKLESSAGRVHDYLASILDLHDDFISGIRNVSSVSTEDSNRGSESLHAPDNGEGHGEVRDTDSSDETVSSDVRYEGPVSIPASNGDDKPSPFNF